MVQIYTTDPAEQERVKYAEIWKDVPHYKDYSPGLENVDRFMGVIEPALGVGNRLLDAGCGAGVAGLRFEELGLQVTYLDLTDAGLDPRIDRKRFICSPLWSHWHGLGTGFFDYGFCCDVMEHISPEYTMLSAARIIEACDVSWFQIAFLPDTFGHEIGKELHLTVQSFTWWRDRLASLGKLIDARDMGERGVFVVQR